MGHFREKLESVKKTGIELKTKPSEVMAFLGVKRRGWRVNKKIIHLLEEYDLMADPAFEDTWKWGEVMIKKKPKVRLGTQNQIDDYDPTPRLSLLRASNLESIKEEDNSEIGLVSVKKQATIDEVITLMFKYNFSQIPILLDKRRAVGIVSWESIGKALALGKECKTAMDCIDEVTILKSSIPLFDAVKIIREKGIVLVRQANETISGIITANDIGEQFISLAEPFLLIEQIENHIRLLLDEKFTPEELKEFLIQNGFEFYKDFETLSDLTFGAYTRIIENPQNFEKLNLYNINKKQFTSLLDDIRNIRNDIMHFDPDGISKNDLELLQRTANFLHKIHQIKKS